MSSASLSDRTIEGKSSGTSAIAIAAVTEHNAIEIRKIARRLERAFEHSTYLIANSFSVTDIVVSHVLNWADLNRVIDEYHHCITYLDRMKARPACSLVARKRPT